MRKKKKPAWPWLIASSFSMVGNSGEKITRAMKLSRKIAAKKKYRPGLGRQSRVQGFGRRRALMYSRLAYR